MCRLAARCSPQNGRLSTTSPRRSRSARASSASSWRLSLPSCPRRPTTGREAAHERAALLADHRLRDHALPCPHCVRDGAHLALSVRSLRLDEPLVAALRAAPAAGGCAALPLRHAPGDPRPRHGAAAPQVVDHGRRYPRIALLRVFQGHRHDGRGAHRQRSRGPHRAPRRQPPGRRPLFGGELLSSLQLPMLTRRYNERRVVAVYVFVNSGIAIAVMAALAMVTEQPFAFPSLGPTAFLLFYQPLAPNAAPRSSFFGHLIGVLAGYLSPVVSPN